MIGATKAEDIRGRVLFIAHKLAITRAESPKSIACASVLACPPQLTKVAYNHSVPVFMCRWPNGDLSFVSARNKEDAIIMLDEWDNAELAELRQIQNFMVDFRLTDDGGLELQAFGERSLDDIWDRAYPLLSQTRLDALSNSAGDLTLSGKEMIRKAVQAEKQRLTGKKKRKLADTELANRCKTRWVPPLPWSIVTSNKSRLKC